MSRKAILLLIILMLLANTNLTHANKGEDKSEAHWTQEESDQIIERLHYNRQHLQVCLKGLELLEKKNLKPEEDANIRYRMAQSMEVLPKTGRLAREKYGEILEMHPNYHRNIQIACRLGQLNDNVILENTQKNNHRAMECYKFVIEKTEEKQKPHEKVIYLDTLEAHMGLGNLYLQQGEYDLAQEHFEFIYYCNPSNVVLLPSEEIKTHNISIKQYEQLRKQVSFIKERIPQKLVDTCMRQGGGVKGTRDALNSILKKHKNDAQVVEVTSNKLKDVDEFEKKLEEQKQRGKSLQNRN